MKYGKWILLVASLAMLAGCGVTDFLFGVEEQEVQIIEKVEVTDPKTGEKTIEERVIGTEKRPVKKDGQSPIELIFGLLGLGGIGGTARWLYTEARIRKLDGAFKATVAGITKAVDDGLMSDKGKVELYAALSSASEIYSNRDFFVKAVARIKDEVRALKSK